MQEKYGNSDLVQIEKMNIENTQKISFMKKMCLYRYKFVLFHTREKLVKITTFNIEEC
mgnify:CR=1 FL=1